jgi:hypothetical protein
MCRDRLSSWGDRGTWPGLLGRAICLILTRLSVGARALRANRSAHESREWARCARERIGGAETCWGWWACGRITSTRWWRTSCMQARRCALRLQSRKTQGGRAHRERMRASDSPGGALSSGGRATDTVRARGTCDSLRSWRRRAPVASHRARCAAQRGCSVLPAGQKTRPVGLEGKVRSCEATSFPRRVAVAGGPYPGAGAGESAACSLFGAMAGANSVVRMEVGSS